MYYKLGLKTKGRSLTNFIMGLQNLGGQNRFFKGGRGNIRLFQCYPNTGNDGAKYLNSPSAASCYDSTLTPLY